MSSTTIRKALPHQEPHHPEAYRTTSASRPLRVLVVDNYEDNAQSTAWLLQLYGFESQIAPNGPAALKAAQANPPDVVLLELALPGMDGYQFAKLLRRQSTGQQPFLIAITGYGQETYRQRSAEAGIDLHWLKPIDPTHLFHQLRGLTEPTVDRLPLASAPAYSRPHEQNRQQTAPCLLAC
ncbi:MAG: response regulator [Gemmataceae bacterium]|nr:response regulator [Gemmataceae bacterium]